MWKMGKVNIIQILNNTVCISNIIDALGKGKNPTILSLAMAK